MIDNVNDFYNLKYQEIIDDVGYLYNPKDQEMTEKVGHFYNLAWVCGYKVCYIAMQDNITSQSSLS